MSTGEYPYDEIEAVERAVLEFLLTAYIPGGSEGWEGEEAKRKIEEAARAFVAALDRHQDTKTIIRYADAGGDMRILCENGKWRTSAQVVTCGVCLYCRLDARR